MTAIELVAVAAISDNLVVGDGPDIPWESLPEDREQYRALVADAPAILGPYPVPPPAETGAATAYVLGGAAIYELFLPLVDRMVLTRVPGEYDGTARYPEWDAADWCLVAETPYDGFTVQEWERATHPDARQRPRDPTASDDRSA